MAQNQTKEPHSVGDVIEGLEELAEAESEVTIGDVLDKFGNRSFAPIMMVLALIELTPVGAIPGVPTFLALCIILVAVQLLIGREHIWVPNWIENRSTSGKKISKATGKLESVAEKVDNIAHSRLEWLATGPGLRAAAAAIIVLALAVAPLEVLPWASAVPMLAIAIISLAIMVRDGVAMLVAWVLAGLALSGAVYYYVTSDTSGSSILPF